MFYEANSVNPLLEQAKSQQLDDVVFTSVLIVSSSGLT